MGDADSRLPIDFPHTAIQLYNGNIKLAQKRLKDRREGG